MSDAEHRAAGPESPVGPEGTPDSGSVERGTADGPADSLAALRDALERAEAASTDNWNRYLRTMAELDNLRKRAARDVEAARRAGVERLAGELLPIVDSLEMGLDSAASASVESLVAGKQATLRLLRNAFDKFGIELIDPAGHPFDPQLHEAMSMQPSPTAEPGSVLIVLQRGYRLGDRLLRPARVIVAGEPVASGATLPGDGESPT